MFLVCVCDMLGIGPSVSCMLTTQQIELYKQLKQPLVLLIKILLVERKD